MDPRLLDIILCPDCGGPLSLAESSSTLVRYGDGEREEIVNGSVECVCGRRYPIVDFVLSFAELFPPLLREEAAYWDRYYLWLVEQGSLGFHDLRQGLAPYITQGVPEPFPAADTIDRYDIHHRIAAHPLVRQGRRLLDVGVGLGWTSLYFAREGYEVTAFEPSSGPVTAAKRYAIEQGVFLEYVCAAMGAVNFRPSSFDTVAAFHSLHHVPELEVALASIRGWLRPGGTLAIDEHVGNSRLAASIAAQLNEWAEAEVFPRYRTISPEELSGLPEDPHSALEDTSVGRIMPLVGELFTVHECRPRHVFLDHYPLLYYLHRDRDLAAYEHALVIANQMQDLVRRVDPDGGDYATVVAENIEPARPLTTVEEMLQRAELAEAVMPADAPEEAPPVELEIPGHAEELAPQAERLQELERHLAEQSAWAQELVRELEKKNVELARLGALVTRPRRGPLGRLLMVARRFGRLVLRRR